MKILILMGLFLIPSFGLATSFKERLKESVKAFDRGKYREALKTLGDLDIRNDLDNSDDMKVAFKIRAISYAEINDDAHAEETIRELLFLDPEYKFDLFDTPAKVVDIAQKEKALIDEKNKQLALLNSANKPIILEKPPSIAPAFLPMGLNHFNSSPLKGGIYLSVQSLGLLTNISAFWWKQTYLNGFGGHRLKNEDSLSSFTTAQVAQYVGLGALVLGYAVSVIDSLIQINKTPPSKPEIENF